MKAAGADFNANTNTDATVYHVTFSKEDLDTILMLEADRFQNLKYSPEDFKTETLAVLGEYNKNSADPTEKLDETVLDTAFGVTPTSTPPWEHSRMWRTCPTSMNMA